MPTMKFFAMIPRRSSSGIHPPSLGRTVPPANPIPIRVWRFSTCAGALRTLRPRAASTTRPLRWKATQLAAVRPAAKTTAAGAPCSIARRDRPRLRDAWALRSVRPERAPDPVARFGARPRTWGLRTVRGRLAPKWPPRLSMLRQFVRGESPAQRVLGDHARLDELHEVVRTTRLPAYA